MRELHGFMESGYSISEYETIPVPGHCTVSGMFGDQSKPTIHQRSTFTITAKDANDTQLEGGGDAFFVHIRGADRARARVADNHDGTYTVAWKPTISGKYKICVSLFGEALKGSPFEVTVDGPVPHPSRCEVRGEALFRTTARVPSTFEISFRDRAGNTARPCLTACRVLSSIRRGTWRHKPATCVSSPRTKLIVKTVATAKVAAVARRRSRAAK